MRKISVAVFGTVLLGLSLNNPATAQTYLTSHGYLGYADCGDERTSSRLPFIAVWSSPDPPEKDPKLKIVSKLKCGETVVLVDDVVREGENWVVVRSGKKQGYVPKSLVPLADSSKVRLASSVSLIPAGKEGQAICCVDEMPEGPLIVIQPVFGGRAEVSAAIIREPGTNLFYVFPRIKNKSISPAFSVDDAKFFVLDADGQQFERKTLEEINYDIRVWVFRNLRNTDYAMPEPPPPPPPPRSYRITGYESGTYHIDLSTGTISGHSYGTYRIEPETDLSYVGAQLGYGIAALVQSLRKWRAERHNRKLRETAERLLEALDSAYFRAEQPILPGEPRKGVILFRGARDVTLPLKLILFLTDPATGKEETVMFQFQR